MVRIQRRRNLSLFTSEKCFESFFTPESVLLESFLGFRAALIYPNILAWSLTFIELYNCEPKLRCTQTGTGMDLMYRSDQLLGMLNIICKLNRLFGFWPTQEVWCLSSPFRGTVVRERMWTKCNMTKQLDRLPVIFSEVFLSK